MCCPSTTLMAKSDASHISSKGKLQSGVPIWCMNDWGGSKHFLSYLKSLRQSSIKLSCHKKKVCCQYRQCEIFLNTSQGKS